MLILIILTPAVKAYIPLEIHLYGEENLGVYCVWIGYMLIYCKIISYQFIHTRCSHVCIIYNTRLTGGYKNKNSVVNYTRS